MAPTVQQIITIVIFAFFVYTAWLAYRIFNAKSSSKQKLLVAMAVALLVTMTGQLQEQTFKTVEAVRLAISIRYIGEIWFVTFLLFLICRICEKQLPKWSTIAIKVMDVIFVCVLYSDTYTHFLFDVRPSVENILGFQTDYLFKPAGWVMSFYVMALMVAAIAISIANGVQKGKPNTIVIMAVLVFVSEAAYIMYNQEWTNGLDVSFIFQILAIQIIYSTDKNYHLLDDGTIAQTAVLDEAADGFIILDTEHNVRQYNKIAAMLYPELLDENERKVITELIFLHNHEMLEHNGKKCDVVVSELIEYDDLTGYVVWLYDRTDEYNCMMELTRLQNLITDSTRTRDLYNLHMSKGIDAPVNILKSRAETIIGGEDVSEDVKELAGEMLNATTKLADMTGILADYMEDRNPEEWPIYRDYSLDEMVEPVMEQLKFHETGRCKRVKLSVQNGVPEKWYGSLDAILLITSNLMRFSVMTSIPSSIEVEVGMDARFSESLMVISLFFFDKGSVVNEMSRLDAKVQRGEDALTEDVNYIPYHIINETLTSLGGSMDMDTFGNSSKITLSIPQRVVGPQIYESSRVNVASHELVGGVTTISKSIHVEENDENIEANNVIATSIKTGEQPVALVVDDNVLYLREMDACLRRFGAKPIVTKSGIDALDVFRKKHIDIVFMDHMMPEMDGTQTLTELRRVEKEVGIEVPVPVILLTADDTVGARKKYLSRGFNDYISKPVEPHEIESKLKAFLGEWQ